MMARIVDIVVGYGMLMGFGALWGLVIGSLFHPEFELWYAAGFAAAVGLIWNRITKRRAG